MLCSAKEHQEQSDLFDMRLLEARDQLRTNLCGCIALCIHAVVVDIRLIIVLYKMSVLWLCIELCERCVCVRIYIHVVARSNLCKNKVLRGCGKLLGSTWL